MSITIATNIEGFKTANRALFKSTMDAIKGAIDIGVVRMHAKMVQDIKSGPKSGATYLRIPGPKYMTIGVMKNGRLVPVAFFKGSGKQGISPQHTASAPGQAPATDTGALVQSIRIAAFARTSKALGAPAVLVVGAAHAKFLEFGTKAFNIHSKDAKRYSRGIKPRPFISPAFQKYAPQILQDISALMLAAARKQARGQSRALGLPKGGKK